MITMASRYISKVHAKETNGIHQQPPTLRYQRRQTVYPRVHLPIWCLLWPPWPWPTTYRVQQVHRSPHALLNFRHHGAFFTSFETNHTFYLAPIAPGEVWQCQWDDNWPNDQGDQSLWGITANMSWYQLVKIRHWLLPPPEVVWLRVGHSQVGWKQVQSSWRKNAWLWPSHYTKQDSLCLVALNLQVKLTISHCWVCSIPGL